MEALADVSALEARFRTLTSEETIRANALLADASARVRAWTRQDFSVATDDQVVLRSDGDGLVLPQRPVISVASVVAVGSNGLPDITLAGWVFDGLDRVVLAGTGTVINMPEWFEADRFAGAYRVTYTHGHDEVPGDVIAVVCAMVLRCLSAPTMFGGVTGETIGPYSYRMESAGGGTAVRLTEDDKRDLRGYRREAGMSRMRLG